MIASLLAAEPASASVTQWPLRILLVLVVVAVIGLVLLGMRRGWKRRARSQGEIPAPPEPGGEPGGDGVVSGVFVGSTSHGDWLDRIVVHDLGVRSRVVIQVRSDGVALWRHGARDVFIPAESLRGADLARGLAGKAYERDGVLVVTWELGGRLIDTGLRADASADQSVLLESIQALSAEQGRAGGMAR